jgi:hypothetical protein
MFYVTHIFTGYDGLHASYFHDDTGYCIIVYVSHILLKICNFFNKLKYVIPNSIPSCFALNTPKEFVLIASILLVLRINLDAG